MKRLFSFLLVCVLTAALIAGCSSAQSPSGSSSPPASNKPPVQAPEYINLMTPWELPKAILDKYKEKTGTEVKQDVVPNSTTDYLQARNARMASGSELDIIGADHSDPAIFAADGTAVEMTNESWMSNLDADSLKLISQYTSTPGKQYSVVYEALTFGVWYNKDMFKQYGIEVPANFEEFIAVCDKLKSNGVAPLVQGGKDVWPFDQELNMLLENAYNTHPTFWVDLYQGKIKFTDADIVKEAQKLSIMLPDKGYYAEGSLSTTYDQAWQVMLQKKAAMWFMGSWASEVMSGSGVQPDFEVGVFVPPFNDKGESQWDVKILSRHYMVLSKSKKIDAAKDFLGFMTQPEIAQIYADQGKTISSVKGVKSSTMVAGADWAKVFTLPSGGENLLNNVGSDGKLYVAGTEFQKIKNANEAYIVDGSMTIEQYCESLQKAVELDIASTK